jgi:hypothetical protein
MASGTAVRLQACGRNEGAAAGQWTSEARMEAVALFQASSVTCYREFAFNFSSASRAILVVIFSSSSYALPSFYLEIILFQMRMLVWRGILALPIFGSV